MQLKKASKHLAGQMKGLVQEKREKVDLEAASEKLSVIS